MQKIIAVALLAASLGAIPATSSYAVETANSAHCGPGAPEGYKRPGGFCDQLRDKNSLIEQVPCDDYYIYRPAVSTVDVGDAPLLVADNCYYFDGPWLL